MAPLVYAVEEPIVSTARCAPLGLALRHSKLPTGLMWSGALLFRAGPVASWTALCPDFGQKFCLSLSNCASDSHHSLVHHYLLLGAIWRYQGVETVREQGDPQTGSLSVTNGAATDPAAETRCQLFPMIFPRLAFTAKAADRVILLVLNPMLAR
jgi:hypothetical protein